jgi:hypothetical protein
MPEITSAETVRAKLADFEERVDGAIVAAKTLARIRGDAERFIGHIEAASIKSRESLLKTEAIEQQLQKLANDWESLKNEVVGAKDSLSTALAEAKEVLIDTNKASLAEQAGLLKQLDSTTRGNAEKAENAKSLVVERAAQLDELLLTIKDQLQREIDSKLSRAEQLFDSQLKAVTERADEKYHSMAQTLNADVLKASQDLTETAAGHERLLRDEANAVRQEIRRSLSDHEQSIDRRITEFLGKQNALVQNLQQGIDSYHGVSQSLTTQLAGIKSQLDKLTSEVAGQTAITDSQLSTLGAGLTALQARMDEMHGIQVTQGNALKKVSDKLTATIEKLASRSWFTGVR